MTENPGWVLFTTYRRRLARLKVLYGTRFGFKHPIMVQLAKVHWIGIIDPFLYLRGPSWGSQKDHFLSKSSLFGDLDSLFMVQKCILSVVTTSMEHCRIFQTISGHIGPFDDLYRGQKAGFGTLSGHRRAIFAHKLTFWEPQEGPLRSRNGSVMPTQWILASWTIVWCLEPNLMPYKTFWGAKIVL